MKIFFTASFSDSTFDHSLLRKLYDQIENLGYEHVDTEIIEMTKEKFEALKADTREDQIARFNRKEQAMKKADICVFETSSHSMSTGFMVHMALELQKPVLALYYEDRIPYFISGVQNEKLLINSYNLPNIKEILKESLEKVREKRDKRFNFFISPKLLEFLESESTADGVTKSKYIRNLIAEHMRENRAVEDTAQ